MLDRHLEPDPVDLRCECGECEACCGDWEFQSDYQLNTIKEDELKLYICG